jgi:hypothetical protein
LNSRPSPSLVLLHLRPHHTISDNRKCGWCARTKHCSITRRNL